jgi:glycyl-tRNA synthetase
MFSLDTIVARAKRKWFVYPNSEIYGWLANSWDYGPYGALLKKNITDAWTKYFTQERSDIIYLDTAIINHPTTWVASGHVWVFSDALIDDKKTGQRFRADKLIEEYLEKIRDGLNDKDLAKKLELPNLSPEARGNDGMYQFIIKFIPNNPDTKKPADWTECRNFNLMLSSHLGPIADENSKVYLRPETCQPLFTNFKNICDTTRNRIPFGLAQIGKAFRNEITPGQFLYRTREFEQMEIEYFIPADADQAMKVFNDWKDISMKYRQQIIWIKPERLRFKDHEKLAHYAAAATDIEYTYPRGFGEIQWIHSRTDFDLKQHQEHAKVSMQYTDPKSGQRYIPRCVEASFGLGRTVMVAMLEFYDEEVIKSSSNDEWIEWEEKKPETENTRVVVRFPFHLAPIKYAIMPLVEKNEDMVTLGQAIYNSLKKKYYCELDLSGGIGKRYRRQDEIGTPYCICVDHQSLEDWTVTVRDRDTMEQTRVKWDEIGK